MRTRIICFLVLLSIVFSIKAQSVDDDLVVRLDSSKSKIRGHILQSENGRNYYSFQQVPYASPPVGNLRFMPPQKPASWDGILDATNNTKICRQVISSTLPQDEDCLFVNVYTPVKPKSKNNLAVYVWYHGGGYNVWDASFIRFGPQYFMDYNIVVVTVQYRLGAFGFLTTEDGLIPGNNGLRDQTLALHWVKENIHLFGGDPKKVTIGGESVGASTVSFLMLSPLSRGLFRAGIQESGSAMCTYVYQDRANYYAFELGKLIDSSLVQGDSRQLLNILQQANASVLVDAQTKLVNKAQLISLNPDLIFVPIIETSVKTGEAFLYEPMDQQFRSGQEYKVPTMLGFNKEEMIWYLPGPLQNKVANISLDQLNNIIANLDQDPSRLINHKLNILDSDKSKAGSLIKKLYTKGKFADDIGAYLKFSSDIYFSLATVRQADLASRHNPNVYLYQFSYTPYNKSFIQGAEHTEELPYFWKFVDDLPLVDNYQKVIQVRLLKLWTNFIKYLNPTPRKDEDLNNKIWPAVRPKKLQYLDITKNLDICHNPRNYIQYNKIVSQFMKPPFFVY